MARPCRRSRGFRSRARATVSRARRRPGGTLGRSPASGESQESAPKQEHVQVRAGGAGGEKTQQSGRQLALALVQAAGHAVPPSRASRAWRRCRLHSSPGCRPGRRGAPRSAFGKPSAAQCRSPTREASRAALRSALASRLSLPIFRALDCSNLRLPPVQGHSDSGTSRIHWIAYA
jgi:hypothetical protein